MFSLNRAQIIGNVTRIPEVKAANGTKVATFGVATNFVWKDQAGVKKEKVEFHNVVAWRKLAEICELYVRKGSKIFVEGRIQTRDWEGEDGVKRYRTEIVMDNMILLDKKGSSAPSTEATEGSGSPFQPAREQRSLKEKTETGETKEEEISIDDLPF